jgi:predicted outer membrane repeat protein
VQSPASSFTGNSANTQGGAIASLATATPLNLTSDTFTTNIAALRGGGIYGTGGTTTLDTTKVFLNRAGTSGGGIFRLGGTVTFLNNSQVILNTRGQRRSPAATAPADPHVT